MPHSSYFQPECKISNLIFWKGCLMNDPTFLNWSFGVFPLWPQDCPGSCWWDYYYLELAEVPALSDLGIGTSPRMQASLVPSNPIYISPGHMAGCWGLAQGLMTLHLRSWCPWQRQETRYWCKWKGTYLPQYLEITNSGTGEITYEMCKKTERTIFV